MSKQLSKQDILKHLVALDVNGFSCEKGKFSAAFKKVVLFNAGLSNGLWVRVKDHCKPSLHLYDDRIEYTYMPKGEDSIWKAIASMPIEMVREVTIGKSHENSIDKLTPHLCEAYSTGEKVFIPVYGSASTADLAKDIALAFDSIDFEELPALKDRLGDYFDEHYGGEVKLIKSKGGKHDPRASITAHLAGFVRVNYPRETLSCIEIFLEEDKCVIKNQFGTTTYRLINDKITTEVKIYMSCCFGYRYCINNIGNVEKTDNEPLNNGDLRLLKEYHTRYAGVALYEYEGKSGLSRVVYHLLKNSKDLLKDHQKGESPIITVR